MAEPRYETIRPRTRALGRHLIHVAIVGSTMDEARRLAEAGAEHGTVVVADEQTQGRGRLDRRWFSPRGSLLATVILRPQISGELLPPVPLAAGLSLARSMEKLVRAPARLKWPNDVWLEGKKVAGILVESQFEGSAPRFILLGMGVNGDVRATEFPPEIRPFATSLSEWAGRHVCLPALLKLFLEDFEREWVELEAGRTGPLIGAVAQRSLVIHQLVRVETPQGAVVGRAVGLGPQGQLIVDAQGSRHEITVGDCVLLRTEEASSP